MNSNVRAGSSPALSTKASNNCLELFLFNNPTVNDFMGTFVITQRNSGFYKYEFTSRKGKTILVSNDFELRFECEEHIEYVKNKIEAVFFMKFKSKNGKLYFKMILDEKEIAVSRKYTTQLLMEKGINEIIRSFAVSEVLDFSSQDFAFPDAADLFE